MTNPDREELVKLADRLECFQRILEGARKNDNNNLRVWSSDAPLVSEAATTLRRLASPDSEVKGEPVRWEWCCFEDNEQRTGWQCEGHGDQKGWEKLVESNPAKYRIVRRPLFTAPPADAGMREALEPFGEYKMTFVAFSDAVSKSDLNDCTFVAGFTGKQPEFRHFDAARKALIAPGATTKSDGGASNDPVLLRHLLKLANENVERLADKIAEMEARSSPSDHSSTRSEVTALTKRLDQVLKVMRGARNRSEPMAVWADDIKAVEDARALLD